MCVIRKPFQSIASLPSIFTIDILINNAGNAHGLDPIQNGDLDDWDAMIDINVKGLLYVSKAIIPQNDRKEIRSYYQHRFHCCKEVYQTEMYIVLQNMRLTPQIKMDLNPFGIRVGAIHPGMVQTEFSEVRFKGDTDRAEKYIKGSCPYNQKISPTSFTLWYRDRIIADYCTGFYRHYIKKELEYLYCYY
jgi:NADP-dependent 3-hydroxy acid dehydrogenase YdfG